MPEGPRTIILQHAAFDSLGLSGASVQIVAQKKTPKVVLAVPSFATLWRAACGPEPAPNDSVLLYGAVSTTGDGLAYAHVGVEVSWVDLVGGGASLATVGQRRWRRTTQTDDTGDFALCGVAFGTPLTVRVMRSVSDTTTLLTLQLPAAARRVHRRDLVLNAVPAATDEGVPVSRTADEAPAHGTVAGLVTDANGVPLANAVIAVDTLLEVRSGEDGPFAVSGVGAGTRQLWVVAIGKTPVVTTINVVAGDTTTLAIGMQTVQVLAAVKVSAAASTIAGFRLRTYEDNKRTGLGNYRDSTDFTGVQSVVNILRGIPGLTVLQNGGGLTMSSLSCPALRFVLDGIRAEPEDVLNLLPRELAALEVYKRRLIFPMDGAPCTVVLWTKRAFGR